MRQKLIVGNWKMHGTREFTRTYLEELLPNLPNPLLSKVMLSVPYTLIALAAENVRGSPVEIGAQNMHEAKEGAFTGEISSDLLQEAGASFVIIGHSERRQFFNETGIKINEKIHRALSVGLRPVLCIGETFLENKNNQTKAVLEKQLQEALAGFYKVEIKNCIVAYEPVWAIGTGNSPTPEMVEDIHGFCRECLVKMDKEFGEFVPILYGGSVNEKNAFFLFQKQNVDGALVGGASLDPQRFLKIIQFS